MKTNRHSSAQSMIEFTLLLPLLFLLVMGLFDIGRAIFYFAVLNSAVREGTRYAIVQPYYDYESVAQTSSDGFGSSLLDCNSAGSLANENICLEISKKLFNIGELSTSTITITRTVSNTNDPVIRISIDFLFTPVTPGIALIGDIPMHVNSQMLLTPIATP